jgi:hypothetical protein
MLAAGERAIWEELGTLGSKMGPYFDAPGMAEKVYLAMASFAPKRTSALVLKLDTSGLEKTISEFTEGVAEFKALLEAAEEDTPC